MTMFSQKAPFDMTEFLGRPASAQARNLAALQRRTLGAMRQRYGVEIAVQPVIAVSEPMTKAKAKT